MQLNNGAEPTSSDNEVEWDDDEITRPLAMNEMPPARSHVRTFELKDFTIEFHPNQDDNRASIALVDELLAQLQAARRSLLA